MSGSYDSMSIYNDVYKKNKKIKSKSKNIFKGFFLSYFNFLLNLNKNKVYMRHK